MESGGRARGLMMALLALASTAALVYFGNGLDPRWPLMWFAPLPVLVYALRSSAWRAGLGTFEVGEADPSAPLRDDKEGARSREMGWLGCQ